MSRVIKKDFDEILKYIENFNLKSLLKEDGFTIFISIYHKKYYSYFALITELENSIPKNEYLYLKESNSDLITCLFHLTTGNYKSSKLILRSSIECFLKGFSLSFLPNIDKEKSVYELFDKIKTIDFFKNEPNKSEFRNLHNIYKILCKDVHTAEEVNMANINSLDFFPKYSKVKVNEIIKIVLKLIPSYCFLISKKYNSNFHKIHHSFKDLILKTIEKDLRPEIMNTND
ncbi:hypothetical protein [Flavobacterium sp.]|uniref:hypothetical protein n=1 Tax=Flavobacterium sp. TaxID=239 RepID=UPI003528031E